jgi:hypothetical protein
LFFAGAVEFIRRHRPSILSEVCPPKLKAVAKMSGLAYLDVVEELGYNVLSLKSDGSTRPFDRSVLEKSDHAVNVVLEAKP